MIFNFYNYEKILPLLIVLILLGAGCTNNQQAVIQDHM